MANAENILASDLKELAEHITYKIQTLLTSKYTNSFMIAHGIIEQEILRYAEYRNDLAALRPVIEKLVEAGQALNDWAELNKNGVIEREGWRAALESWKVANGK